MSINLIAEGGPQPGAKQLSSSRPAFKTHGCAPTPVLGAGGQVYTQATNPAFKTLPPGFPSILPYEFLQFIFQQ